MLFWDQQVVFENGSDDFVQGGEQVAGLGAVVADAPGQVFVDAGDQFEGGVVGGFLLGYLRFGCNLSNSKKCLGLIKLPSHQFTGQSGRAYKTKRGATPQ